MSKYEPLERLLRSCSQTEVPLTFDNIEEILGFRLPESARRHRGWWANEQNSHVQARAWMKAGWRAWEVDLDTERVLFRRREPAADDRALSRPDVIQLDVGALPYAAARLLRDYASESDGDFTVAVVRALQEAAIARRNRLIDRIRQNAPKVPGDSTDLIREDRDAR